MDYKDWLLCMNTVIENFAFGRIVVSGTIYSNDIKIVQGKVISEWWRKRGHLVEQEDIEDILASKPDILVIGKGKLGLLKVSPMLRKFLAKTGIKLIEEKTTKAVYIFNRLSEEGKNVAAGIHTSC